jgi:hypothetical protein
MDNVPGAATYRNRKGKRPASGAATAVSSKLVTLRISESPVAGMIGTIAGEQGSDVTAVCQIKRRGPLPEQLTATLEGLPNRVAARPVAVSAEDQRVAFALHLEPTAPVGSFPSLLCRLTGLIDGQEVSYCVGRGGVLKIEPAGGLVLDDAGRPLSPLEALRRSQKRIASEKTPAK